MTVPAENPPQERKIGPLVWFSLIAPIVFVIFLLVYEVIAPIYLSVSNQSDRPLTGITVAVQEHKLAIPDLAPGQSFRLWFRNQRTTSPYTLSATLGGEQKIEKTEGELRSGMLHGFYGPASFTVETDGSVSFSEN